MGGFTEFVPLPFVHMEAPIYLKGRARRGTHFPRSSVDACRGATGLPSSANEHSDIMGKDGRDGVKVCLDAGANDLGGTLMDETITRSAGAIHGQEMTPNAMEGIIQSIGESAAPAQYVVRQRAR